MDYLPENLFSNPVWHSLQGDHRHLAQILGDACRYPADVTPFAALAEPSAAALGQLRSLLAPGDSVWIVDRGERQGSGLCLEGTLGCLQMVLPREATLPAPAIPVVPLSTADAAEMVALTDLAFPGFFRANTQKMGSYWGVRADGELVAMGGERLRLHGNPELSGICTHPAHRGKGFARNIILQLAGQHRRAGRVSWLQVGIANTNAIELYRDIGFKEVRTIMLHRISRID